MRKAILISLLLPALIVGCGTPGQAPGGSQAQPTAGSSGTGGTGGQPGSGVGQPASPDEQATSQAVFDRANRSGPDGGSAVPEPAAPAAPSDATNTGGQATPTGMGSSSGSAGGSARSGSGVGQPASPDEQATSQAVFDRANRSGPDAPAGDVPPATPGPAQPAP